MARNPLIDCVGKAKRVGILTDAEMQFVLKRAAELGNEKQAVNEIHAQRLKEYEAIKEPTAADKVVITTANENVAMAAYTEEVRIASKKAISPEKKTFEKARQAKEKEITGEAEAYVLRKKTVAQVTEASAEADIEATRQFLVSVQQQGHVVRPTTEQMQQAALDMGTKLIALHGISNVKMQDTFGMYQGAHNRQFLTYFDAGNDANLMSLIQEAAKEAGRTGHDSFTIARVLGPNEDSPNARPGIDVTFKQPIPVERIDDIVRFLRDRGIDGFDLIPSGTDWRTGTPRTFTGLRFQEIPEFSQQPRARKHDVLVELSEELMKMNEVAAVTHQLYDTLVLTKQDYDKNGILKGAVGAIRAAAWADRAYLAANPQAASLGIQAGPIEQKQAAALESRTPKEVTPQKELETAAALVAAGKAAPDVAVLVYTEMYRRVLDLMQQNRAAMEGMKWSSATPESVRAEGLLRALGELDAILKYSPAEVRGQVGGYFQLAKVGVGEKALAKFFGDRIRTLERVLERYLKKQYLGEIKDLLDKSKAKTQHGIKKSARMDADAQAAVEAARVYSKLDANGVAKTTIHLDSVIANVDSSAEERLLAEQGSAILALFGDMTHRSASELYTAKKWLRDVVETGRDAWKQKAKAITKRNESRAQELIGILGQPDIPGLVESEQKATHRMQIAKQFLVGHLSFIQFLDYLAPNASFTKDWQRMARESDNAKMDFHRAASDRLHNAIAAAVGGKGFNAFGKASVELKALHKDAVHFKGKPLRMSKLDAIQYILSWEQADVRSKMEAMGFTEKTMQEIRDLASDDVSKAVYTFLRKEYAQMYDKVNPLYREIYGVDMPRILLYAPTRYHHGENTPEIATFGGSTNTSGSTASFMHQRVNHKARMRQENALTVYWQHMSDAANFLSDAQMLREIRGVLTKPEVRDAIKQKYGPAIWEEAKRWMDLMGRASNTKNNELSSVNYFFDSLITTKAMVSLAFNLKSVLMQSDSSTRVVIERSSGEIIRALLDPDFLATVPKAFFSDAIQRRIESGASPAVRYVMEKSELRPDHFMRFARMGMLPLQYFDAYFTSVSAAISYRAAYKEAKDMRMLDAAAEEYAADKMDESIYRYNQPVGMYNRSLLEQTGGPIKRMIMMFISDPRLKTSITMMSVRDIIQGKNRRAAMRSIVAIEFMALFAQTLANVYSDWFTDADDEDIWTVEGYARAAAAAPFAGIFLVGTAIESALSWLFENKLLQSSKDPLAEAIERGVKAATNIEDLWNPDDPKDFLKELDNLSRSLALILAPTPIGSAAASISAVTNFLKPIAGAMENAEKNE